LLKTEVKGLHRRWLARIHTRCRGQQQDSTFASLRRQAPQVDRIVVEGDAQQHQQLMVVFFVL
jgi:hypothetical protein